MQTEYEKGGILLRILDEADAPMTLDFYSKNKDFFAPVEVEKPERFYTLAFQEELLRAEMSQFLQGKSLRFYVFLSHAPQAVIGTISFLEIRRSAFMSCHIGYKIDQAHTGCGYGCKSVSLALDIITREVGLHRIEAYIQPDNLPSIALAKKAGFVPEGTAYDYVKLNGQWCDHLRYIYISAYQ